jgi:S1-C subfamily serine protease
MRIKFAIILSALAMMIAACSSSSHVTKTNSKTPTVPPKTTSVSDTGAPNGSSAATLEQSVIDAIHKVQPAVVLISVTTSQGEAQGSGSIITKDGFILTNDHVVEGATSIKVAATTKTYDATVAGTDPADDLAVIKISATSDLPTLSFTDSAKAQVGQFVIAVGNPLGIGQSASFGIISAVNRSVSEAPSGPANIIPNAIQTSAPINPGNSGGALIDLSGNLIGVPTLGALDPEFGNAPANGVGFAIPANQAKLIADQIIATGKVTNTGRAFLGVSTQDVTPVIAKYNNLPIDHGAIIQQLDSRGPAQGAGLKVGDIIYQLDDTVTNDSNALGSYLATKSPGDKITVKVNRNGSNVSIDVTLGTLPANG